MLIQFLIPAPFYSKSTLSEYKHFTCLSKTGMTAMRQSLNLTIKFDADPFV